MLLYGCSVLDSAVDVKGQRSIGDWDNFAATFGSHLSVYKKDKFWPDYSLNSLLAPSCLYTTPLEKMAILRNSLIATALTLLFSASTNAHVTLSPKFAEPGQNLSTAFHVPHGCNGSATTSIAVTVPNEITVLTPQQVNNWVSLNDKRLWYLPLYLLFMSRHWLLLIVITQTPPSAPLHGIMATLILRALLISPWLYLFLTLIWALNQMLPCISPLCKLGK